MNNLIAEKCREQFEYWAKSFSQEPDLTRANGGANYANSEIDVAWLAWKASRQAIEIALPVLEQQEAPTDTYQQIENDGWIEWGGGNCPVPRDLKVEVRARNDQRSIWDKPHLWDWSHTDNGSDIIAYRVIDNDGKGQK